MLKEIQVNLTKNEVYAMAEDYSVIATLPMSKDFWPGTNSNGEEYCNAPVGTYHLEVGGIYTDGKYPEDGSRDMANDVLPFGWGFINLDDRGHALHGGGSNLGWPASDLIGQELTKTNGCFRLYNEDIYWLACRAKDSLQHGIEVVCTVVE